MRPGRNAPASRRTSSGASRSPRSSRPRSPASSSRSSAGTRSSSTRSRGSDDVAVGPCPRAAARRWYFADGIDRTRRRGLARALQPVRDDAIVDSACSRTRVCRRPTRCRRSWSRGAHACRSRCTTSPAASSGSQSRSTRAPAGSSPSAAHASTARTRARGSRWPGRDRELAGVGGSRSATRWRVLRSPSPSPTSSSAPRRSRCGSSSRVIAACSRRPWPCPAARSDGRRRRQGRGGHRLQRRDRGEGRDAGRRRRVRCLGHAVARDRVASATGIATSARQWAFALGRLDASGDGIIGAVNVGDQPITVQLYAYTAGDPNSPASAPAMAVPPGERAVFSLGERAISLRQGDRGQRRRPDRRRPRDPRPRRVRGLGRAVPGRCCQHARAVSIQVVIGDRRRGRSRGCGVVAQAPRARGAPARRVSRAAAARRAPTSPGPTRRGSSRTSRRRRARRAQVSGPKVAALESTRRRDVRAAVRDARDAARALRDRGDPDDARRRRRRSGASRVRGRDDARPTCGPRWRRCGRRAPRPRRTWERSLELRLSTPRVIGWPAWSCSPACDAFVSPLSPGGRISTIVPSARRTLR